MVLNDRWWIEPNGTPRQQGRNDDRMFLQKNKGACTIRTSVHKGLHWQHRRSDQINLVTSCVRGKLFRDCILGFLVNANTYAVEESSTAYTHHNSKTMTDWKVAQPERKVPITSFATTETSGEPFGIASETPFLIWHCFRVLSVG